VYDKDRGWHIPGEEPDAAAAAASATVARGPPTASASAATPPPPPQEGAGSTATGPPRFGATPAPPGGPPLGGSGAKPPRAGQRRRLFVDPSVARRTASGGPPSPSSTAAAAPTFANFVPGAALAPPPGGPPAAGFFVPAAPSAASGSASGSGSATKTAPADAGDVDEAASEAGSAPSVTGPPPSPAFVPSSAAEHERNLGALLQHLGGQNPASPSLVNGHAARAPGGATEPPADVARLEEVAEADASTDADDGPQPEAEATVRGPPGGGQGFNMKRSWSGLQRQIGGGTPGARDEDVPSIFGSERGSEGNKSFDFDHDGVFPGGLGSAIGSGASAIPDQYRPAPAEQSLSPIPSEAGSGLLSPLPPSPELPLETRTFLATPPAAAASPAGSPAGSFEIQGVRDSLEKVRRPPPVAAAATDPGRIFAPQAPREFYARNAADIAEALVAENRALKEELARLRGAGEPPPALPEAEEDDLRGELARLTAEMGDLLVCLGEEADQAAALRARVAELEAEAETLRHSPSQADLAAAAERLPAQAFAQADPAAEALDRALEATFTTPDGPDGEEDADGDDAGGFGPAPAENEFRGEPLCPPPSAPPMASAAPPPPPAAAVDLAFASEIAASPASSTFATPSGAVFAEPAFAAPPPPAATPPAAYATPAPPTHALFGPPGGGDHHHHHPGSFAPSAAAMESPPFAASAPPPPRAFGTPPAAYATPAVAPPIAEPVAEPPPAANGNGNGFATPAPALAEHVVRKDSGPAAVISATVDDDVAFFDSI